MSDPISDSETSLQQIILQGDLPVLSLYAEQYAAKDRLAVAAILSQGKSPTKAIISGLNRYPALCAVYLTSFLAEHFFENESFEVWPKLAMCLEVQDIPQSQRRELCQAFRHACRRLGLPVSGQEKGPNYMVNEFMRQVGLPLQLAPEFVQHICKAVVQLGLPDPDDTPAVQRWQEALAAYLDGKTTIRILDALRLDHRGHFCRNFLELYLGIRTPACQLEQAMRDALDAPQDGSQPGLIQRTFTLPYLVAQEEALGIFLPLQGTWVIEELHPRGDGRPRHLEADVSGQLHLFSNQRCTEVRVRDTEGPRSWVVPVWKEVSDNILLFFHADTGILAARGVMGDEALELDPGLYRVVATFQPTGGAWEPERWEQSIWSFRLSIEPYSTPQTIARENAKLLVRSSVDPALQWEGEVHTDLTGSRVLASAGARIRAFWPKDTDTLASSPPVVLLRCRHLGLEEELPLHEIDQNSGWLEAELQSSLACWPAGIFAISASLHLQGSRRAQARSSIVLWNGLRYRRNGVFRLDRIPDPRPNELKFREDLHSLVARFPRQLARTCLLTFQDHGRTRQLQYPAPGVHVAILEQGGSSEARWRPLGSEVPLSALSAEHALIHTDQPGRLVMGTLTAPIRARKRLPLVLLHNHLGEATSLEFVGENGTRTEVLRCSTVHVVEGDGFGWTRQEDGSSVLSIHFKTPMRHVAVKAFHLPSTTARRFSWQFPMPVPQCSLPIPCNALDDGPWMLYGLATDGAITGMLVDDQQRPVVKEIVVGATPVEVEPLGQAQGLLQQLRRIHHLLRTFWARPPRGLVREWEQRVQQLATTKRPSILMALLLIEHRRELAEPPEAGLRPRHLGAEALAMYTLPARRYRQLPASNTHPLLVGKTLSCAGDVPQALQQQLLSPAAFTFLHGNSGKTLLFNYCSTIEHMPLQWRGADPPPQEHCLGREHLVHAVDRFACQLQEAISRNDDAANKALALRATVDWAGFQARLTPLKRTASSEDVKTLAALALKEFPEFEGQDFLIRGMHLLASLALACRMEARHPGTLQQWLQHMRKKHESTPLKPGLACFLVAGEELFFYFLLLWEVALESLTASA